MKVSVLWFGGPGWSNPEIEDIEHFNSIKEAEQEFIDRYNNKSLQYPCVGENCNMWVAIGNVNYIEYPDFIISLGPRGGIKRERA